MVSLALFDKAYLECLLHALLAAELTRSIFQNEWPPQSPMHIMSVFSYMFYRPGLNDVFQTTGPHAASLRDKKREDLRPRNFTVVLLEH